MRSFGDVLRFVGFWWVSGEQREEQAWLRDSPQTLAYLQM
jgi:hypothetical protein